MATLKELTTESDFEQTISSLPSSHLAIIYFHAPWAAPCKQMSTILSTLASTYPADAPLTFLSLNAEELSDISEQYDVTAVPYIVLQKNGQTLETISGSDAGKVRAAVEKHSGVSNAGNVAGLPEPQSVKKPNQEPITQNGTTTATSGGAKNLSSYAPSASDPKTAPDYSSNGPVPDTITGGNQDKEELFNRLGELVKAAPVMLFMKGTPSAPQCGFSRQTVGILRDKKIRYGFFNILADDEVRQGLKEFADWPTFPQVWVGGELVGGLDIVKEEFENDPEFLREYVVESASVGGPGA